MKYLSTKWMKPDELDSFPGNYQQHDQAALDVSIRNGQHKPVVARKLDGRFQLLSGHGTRDAIVRAGIDRILVAVLEANDDEALTIVVNDNETSRRSSFDPQKMVDMLKRAEGRDVGFDDLVISASDYDDLMAQLREAAATALPQAPDHGTTWETSSMPELRERYDAKGTRTVAFDLTLDQFTWLVDQFEKLRPARDVTSNVALLVLLVEEASGTTAPPAGPPADDAPPVDVEPEPAA